MSNSIIIKIKQQNSEHMGSSIEALIDVLSSIHNINLENKLTIDLSSLEFVHPFLILPLAALIKYIEQKGITVNTVCPNNTKCKEYLDRIYFNTGLNPSNVPNWQILLEQYNTRTYLPIISVPVGSTNERFKNDVLSVFEQIMKNQLKLNNSLYSTISYISGEAFDNIDQHANVDFGWIMVQNYPGKDYLDVCIADTGKGILQSYIDAGFEEITTHEEALQQAMNGRSAKIYEKARGFGIRTSKRMLVEGLNGKYLLFTGNAFYIWTNEHENISLLNTDCFWPGTMLALRIPKTIPSSFNYINYLE